jgi:hypothetical protein
MDDDHNLEKAIQEFASKTIPELWGRRKIEGLTPRITLATPLLERKQAVQDAYGPIRVYLMRSAEEIAGAWPRTRGPPMHGRDYELYHWQQPEGALTVNLIRDWDRYAAIGRLSLDLYGCHAERASSVLLERFFYLKRSRAAPLCYEILDQRRYTP